MFYSEQQIEELKGESATIRQKYQALLFAYSDRQYQTDRGREFATQGFLRRLGTLSHCIDRVFTILPPDLQGIPIADAVADATISLQAFIFNVFGCMDNLAWVWVEEKGIRKKDGEPLPQKYIGFGAKYTSFRESLSTNFLNYLQIREEWFSHLEGYRHALAHRIPLYIPPHEVSPDNQAAYLALEIEMNAAVLAENIQLEAKLAEQQHALMFFRPWMTHSYEEKAPIVVIHSQMLADFNTVEEVAYKLLGELNQP
jgi:hypothetical protein